MSTTDFRLIKERIRKEKQSGDIQAAADRAGCSRSVFDRAMKKDELDSLTSAETSVIYRVVEVLDERRAQKERILGHV